MTQSAEAVFIHGVLKPTTKLALRESQRVRVIVEPIEDENEDRAEAVARLRAGIASMQFSSKGPLPKRDELHERI